MTKERQVLVIFPHPDDESFGTAGTIIKYVSEGVPVTYLCMTLGEMGRNLGNPPFASRESLPGFRQKELEDAGRALGCEIRQMGLRDKTIEFLDEEAISDKVLQVINEVNPSLIISFYPPYAVHPDHDACGRTVIKAVSKMPEDSRPKLHLVAFSNNCEKELGAPGIVLDITPYAEQKLVAIRAHRSQTEAMTAGWDDTFKNPDAKVTKRFLTERFWEYKFK